MPIGAFKQTILGAAGVSAGDVVLMETYTAGGEGTKVFSNLNSADYKSIIFEFIDLHASADDTDFTFQVRDADDDYGTIEVTTCAFRAYNRQDGTQSNLHYQTSFDALAQTGQIPLNGDAHMDPQYALNGYMTIYNPASTTYATNMVSRLSLNLQSTQYPALDFFVGGYANISKALTAIRFAFDEPDANMDTGIIRQWGVK